MILDRGMYHAITYNISKMEAILFFKAWKQKLIK